MLLMKRATREYTRLATKIGISITRLTAYLALGTLVLFTTLHVRHASARDPGSWFFNPELGYAQRYSATRQRQAERYIAAAADVPPFHRDRDAARLCVGVPSIARDGPRYLRTTIGSLLSGLTQDERDGIHLIVFIPHTDPAVHPAYHEAWLTNLANDVLLYNLTKAELAHVAELERDHGLHREKGLFDYTYLLKACYATNTPYIAMIEDDVVALDGWYHRTVNGLHQAETKSALRKTSQDFLYLRLFYTEEFFGWNGEDWPIHTFWSLATIAGLALTIHWARSTSPAAKRVLTPYLTIILCFILVPWSVLLVFAAGRLTVSPLATGVNEMNNFGCCAQGLVFPRHKAHDLIQWFEKSHLGFADSLTEQYANDHGEQRWALTPSVLQHIGAKSSKADDSGPAAKHKKSAAETIWNFAFELNDAKVLRLEHERAALDAVAIR
nr:hypothetical protein B0A51_14906 [Rachicladosporium sp. CCFEE 5018]